MSIWGLGTLVRSKKKKRLDLKDREVEKRFSTRGQCGARSVVLKWVKPVNNIQFQSAVD